MTEDVTAVWKEGPDFLSAWPGSMPIDTYYGLLRASPFDPAVRSAEYQSQADSGPDGSALPHDVLFQFIQAA